VAVSIHPPGASKVGGGNRDRDDKERVRSVASKREDDGEEQEERRENKDDRRENKDDRRRSSREVDDVKDE
jgi:hypothetical protein